MKYSTLFPTLEECVRLNDFQTYSKRVEAEEFEKKGIVHPCLSSKCSALSAFNYARLYKLEVSCGIPDETTHKHLQEFAKKNGVQIEIKDTKVTFKPAF